MKPEIAFFDIDGTLVSLTTRKMSGIVAEALVRLRESGCRIFLATGRAPFTLPEFENISFDGRMCFNGSFAADGEGVIYSSPLDKADISRVLKNAEAIGQPVIAATAESRGYTFYSPLLDDYIQFSKAPCGPLETENLEEEDIYQITVPTEKDLAAQLLEGTSHFAVTRWWEKAVDIIPVTGGKAAAMEKILEHYGISRENTAAFGDSTNDIDMLQYAGIGIAMGNADGSVKKEADYIADTCENDGVAHALEDFGWI